MAAPRVVDLARWFEWYLRAGETSPRTVETTAGPGGTVTCRTHRPPTGLRFTARPRSSGT
jgi:hypothetical protein